MTSLAPPVPARTNASLAALLALSAAIGRGPAVPRQRTAGRAVPAATPPAAPLDAPQES